MPPIVHIDADTKRRLEHTYHHGVQSLKTPPGAPSHTSGADDPGHDQSFFSERMASSPHALFRETARSSVSSATGARQDQRSLPSQAVTDDTFDEAYVNFILYCNPSIPLETDTAELRRTFRSPPKSDGKSFNTFGLFELIRKLEFKEIKTWAQLAIDLGVEPPAFEKGQSAQKVQQYAVRLKRWMHAMHVDAFFEYLLNKSHVYWTNIPSAHSEYGRDGVAAEEDLALRALLPETKPKRGRRKAGDRDDDSEIEKSPSQRPRLHSPSLSEDFMIARVSMTQDNTPASAHPGGFQDRTIPWSATDVRVPLANTFRWLGAQGDGSQTPMTAYPHSAVTPSNRTSLWSDQNDGSRSAITAPNKFRSKRRHGPAVSSAWPSNGSTSSGKLRGRPPSNRSVTDGPYSTFPANPSTRETANSGTIPTISIRDSATTPTVEEPQIPHFFSAEGRANARNLLSQGSKPSRLQLQVPERRGGSVRLATPPDGPPGLLVNGESDPNGHQGPVSQTGQGISVMGYYNSTDDQSSQFQPFVNITFRQNEDSDRTNVDALESHFICEILAADWCGADGQSISRCSIDEASKICKQVIRNLQDESGSPEAFLMSVTALAGGPLRTHVKMTRLEDTDSKTDYECHWRMRFGSIEGDFTIRATVQHSVATAHGPEEEEIQASWKKRYLDLQQKIRERDERLGFLKKNILEALVVSAEFMKDHS